MKKSIGVSALMNLIMIVGLINPDYANADIKNTNLQESTMQVENTVWGKDSNISYEEYVINLLRDMGQNATIDRWRENLTFLKKHYNEIINEKNGSKSVIDYYISEYESELETENMMRNEVKNQSFSTIVVPTFRSVKVVEYALKYYKKPNPDYPNWESMGGDCANFVSQCLHAGGVPMVGKADSTGKNAANSKNWFSYGNQLDTKKVSSSFRGANAFKNYFLVAAKRKKYFSSNVSNEELYNYVKIGDAVSFCRIEGSNKIAKHTMIVINKKPKTNEVILAAHTSSTNDTILCSKLKSYAGCYIFGMK